MKNNKGEGSVALKEGGGGGLINFLPLKREVLLERGINRGITEYLFSLFIFFCLFFFENSKSSVKGGNCKTSVAV